MYKELMTNLRNCAEINSLSYYKSGLMKQAANAIEELCGLCATQSKDCSEAVAKYLELWAKQPHWIPVTERLPMRGEKAICFGKNGYMIGTYGEFGWMFPCYFGNVTHWMPLPEPPNEDGV